MDKGEKGEGVPRPHAAFWLQYAAMTILFISNELNKIGLLNTKRQTKRYTSIYM